VVDAAAVPNGEPQDECMVERALPGEGTSDLQGLLSAFEEIGATPLIAPEIFNRALAG
jgi:hypothetical protein